MRDPNRSYSYDGVLYGPDKPGRTVADLERLLADARQQAGSASSSTPAGAKGGDPEKSEFADWTFNELRHEVKERDLKPEGTGEGGAVTKQDLIRALEGSE